MVNGFLRDDRAMKSARRLLLAALLAAAGMGLLDNVAFAQFQPVIGLGDCPYGYQPVCGRARKRVLVTYANACTARAAGARVVSHGVCPENCPPVFKPVCARDTAGKRKTYMNACAAGNEKAEVLRRGRCLLQQR
jgi:hypothetical protein